MNSKFDSSHCFSILLSVMLHVCLLIQCVMSSKIVPKSARFSFLPKSLHCGLFLCRFVLHDPVCLNVVFISADRCYFVLEKCFSSGGGVMSVIGSEPVIVLLSFSDLTLLLVASVVYPSVVVCKLDFCQPSA